MRLLALDQATHTTGYSIFDDNELIKHGIIDIKKGELGERMLAFRKQVVNLLTEYNIDEVVVEDVHLEDSKNPITFKMLAEWLGALLELLTELNYPHRAVLPSTWRSTLGINKGDQRRANKKLLAQKYVQTHYGLTVSEDEADSICIGTHYIKLNNKKELNWE